MNRAAALRLVVRLRRWLACASLDLVIIVMLFRYVLCAPERQARY
ncbi:hypothetical protein N8E89_09360 [Phyllobacterium sp. A18/5-2]|nr:hypothetical protein [Phyllobacterium sp. A18/5-2]UXN62923.1 hypothetical protein N8E89_09360 [Phyllobacterium sp. A18/5-2]